MGRDGVREIQAILEGAVLRACSRIHEEAKADASKRGMGTTLSALLVIGSHGFISHVGDSRIYLSRNGVVYPLTEDHSLMNELIRSGKVRADEFAVSPYANFKNAMTRAVGVYASVEVDTFDFDILPGEQHAGGSLTITIEEPEPGALFLRFAYHTSLPDQGEDARYAEFVRSAYHQSDVDCVQIIRTLAAGGLPQ